MERKINYEKYSVLMSLYKKENPEHLRLALDSMINQTVRPDEIVLVEDGPLTPELYAVVKEYQTNYVDLLHIVENKLNLGLGLALQKGLLACRNELIARMDTDDIAKENRCKKQLKYFSCHLEADIVGGQIEEFIDTPETVLGKRIVPCTDKEIKGYIKKRCPFNHMAVMYKKTSVLKAGNYLDFYLNEDYYLWIRMAQKGMIFANLPDVLVYVRGGADMYRRRGGSKYFKSEKKIQNLMLKDKMITVPRYIINLSERFVLQVLMPNWLRGIVFRFFARS